MGPYVDTISFSHGWDKPGDYYINLKLRDMHGHETPWSTLIISILPIKNNRNFNLIQDIGLFNLISIFERKLNNFKVGL